MSGETIPTATVKKPMVLEQGYVLESPAIALAEALRSEKRSGEASVWQQLEGGGKPQLTGNQVWARTVGAFTVVAAVDFVGAGSIRIEGPAGYKAKASEFSAAVVTQLLEGLPASVETYVKGLPAAIPQRAPAPPPAAPQTTVDRGSGGGWLSRIAVGIGIAKQAPKIVVPQDYAAQDRALVRKVFEPLRDSLTAIEDSLPPSETLAPYLEASTALRHALGQALSAIEINDSIANRIATTCAVSAETVLAHIGELADKGQLAQRQGVGGSVAADLIGLNDKIVAELKDALDGKLLDSLTHLAAATGNDAHKAARIAVGAAKQATVGNIPTVTVLELRAQKPTTRATPARVRAVEDTESGITIRKLFEGIDNVNAVGESSAGNCFQIFSSDKYGADELVIASSGIWWNAREGIRDVRDGDLGNVTIEGITAAIDEAADRATKGIWKYFVDTHRVTTEPGQTPPSPNEVVIAFGKQAAYLTDLAKEARGIRDQLAAGTKDPEIEKRLTAVKDELFGELQMLRNSLDDVGFPVTAWLEKTAL